MERLSCDNKRYSVFIVIIKTNSSLVEIRRAVWVEAYCIGNMSKVYSDMLRALISLYIYIFRKTREKQYRFEK